MLNPSIDIKLQIFRSLFKGREDVFATRWEIPARSPGVKPKVVTCLPIFMILTPPENFSRVLHDYADDQKGFVIWRHALEERLV